MKRIKAIDIIYDGRCQFCIRSLRLISRTDIWNRFRFHGSDDVETFQAFTSVTQADVKDAMFALVEGEKPRRGFFAFRRMLWASPFLWPAIVLFYFPGAHFFGPMVYSWVARNRKAFACTFPPLTADPNLRAPRKE